MKAEKFITVKNNSYGVDERLITFLEDEMGFKLDHVNINDVVERLNKSVNNFDSFLSFASTVSSLIAVHETYFLRHHEQFNWIENRWFLKMLQKNKTNKEVIRILSAGCSTGEEPYSIYAHLATLAKPYNIQVEVDAVDISENALKHARKGSYGLWSLRGVDIKNEQQWLDMTSRNVIVKEWVKKGVCFERKNITKPFFEDRSDYYDLILCRNVMIYMHSKAVENIFINMSRLLKKDAYILPGPSDPNPASNHSLTLVWEDGVRLFVKGDPLENQREHEYKNISISGYVKKSNIENIFSAKNKKEPDDVTVDNKIFNPMTQESLSSKESTKNFHSYHSIESLIKSCEYNSARQLLEANIKNNPLDTRSYTMLAMLALDLDDRKLAFFATQKACFLKPNAPYTAYLMANYKQRIGDKKSEKHDLFWVRDCLKKLEPNQAVEFCEEITIAELRGVVDARLG